MAYDDDDNSNLQCHLQCLVVFAKGDGEGFVFGRDLPENYDNLSPPSQGMSIEDAWAACAAAVDHQEDPLTRLVVTASIRATVCGHGCGVSAQSKVCRVGASASDGQYIGPQDNVRHLTHTKATEAGAE